MNEYELGINYYYGNNGFEKDHTIAFCLLNSAATNGNLLACYFLGTFFRIMGKNKQSSPTIYNNKAFMYYKMLFEHMLRTANVSLSPTQLADVYIYLALAYSGELNISEEEMHSNREEWSVYFYEQALNICNSLPELGYITLAKYYFRTGYYPRAEYLFEIVQKLNSQYCTEAVLHLGLIYEFGLTKVYDYVKAVHYYKLAAPSSKLCNVNINEKIAKLYLTGKHGLAISVSIALAYFKKALDFDLANNELADKIKYYTLPIAAAIHNFPESVANEFNNSNHPAEYTCPIGLGLFMDPVLADDGFSYERKEIIDWCNAHKSRYPDQIIPSPLNRSPITIETLRANRNLMQAIVRYINEKSSEIKEKITADETSSAKLTLNI